MFRFRLLSILFFFLSPFLWRGAGGEAIAQNTLNIVIKDSASGEPVIGATAFIKSIKSGGASNTSGLIKLNSIPDGQQEIVLSFVGYKNKTLQMTFPSNEKEITVLLVSEGELDEVTVSVTRTNSHLDDTPLKVEVLGSDDMDEENTIKPGNVASILGDISGIQIQQSSAVSGNSNVRIQGLGGKYTQMMRDGLPLYDGFSGGFGVMQIPPLDLKQVEIVKGSASTLFGGGAIGGVINFVSKQPGDEPEGIITLNQSTLYESNLNGYYAKRKNKVSVSVFTGGTRQKAVDVNKDGFSDVPQVENVILHPRLFFYFNPKNTLAIGISSMYESRKGGDMTVLYSKSDTAHQFFEQNKTTRNTADLIFTNIASNKNCFSVKGSASLFDRSLTTNRYSFSGEQLNAYSEVSYLIPRPNNDLVGGINFWADIYNNKPIDTAYLKGYEYYTIGSFIQNTFKYKERLFVEAGLRADYHTRYGFFILPRLALLYKFSSRWYTRLGYGAGYKTPNPLVQQNTEEDIRKIQPAQNTVVAENSSGYNAELNYKTVLGDKGSLQINQAVFYTGIQKPITAHVDSLGATTFSNEIKPTVSKGLDTYVRLSYSRFELYLGYTYTLARNEFNASQPYVVLTPRHRAAGTLVYEIEKKWRFGLEGSYNGYQYLNDGTRSQAYFFMAAMIERRFKHVGIVLNGENLLDVRQTRYENIVIKPYTNPTFKPLWGPIDGRVVNLSVVFRL